MFFMARLHSSATELGRVLHRRGHKANWLCQQTEIYPRQMTEYLAGRREPTPAHLIAICRVMNMTPEELEFGQNVNA